MRREFKIEGMHCGSCAALISETLEDTAGIKSAEVTFNSKVAVVDFDEGVVQPEAIVKSVKDLGYSATPS